MEGNTLRRMFLHCISCYIKWSQVNSTRNINVVVVFEQLILCPIVWLVIACERLIKLRPNND